VPLIEASWSGPVQPAVQMICVAETVAPSPGCNLNSALRRAAAIGDPVCTVRTVVSVVT
jgi:hypothetical protein